MASSLPKRRLLSHAVRVPCEAPRLPPLYSRPTGKGALVGNGRRDERDRVLRLAGARVAPLCTSSAAYRWRQDRRTRCAGHGWTSRPAEMAGGHRRACYPSRLCHPDTPALAHGSGQAIVPGRTLSSLRRIVATSNRGIPSRNEDWAPAGKVLQLSETLQSLQ